MTTPVFVPGLELSRRFYLQAVRPVLEETTPGILHSAALLGSGSEVLEFDTARSRDHDWGPRLQIFLATQDAARHSERLSALLAERLPKTFCGYPTHFALTGETGGIGLMQETDCPVHHRVNVTVPTTWFTSQLGFDPTQDVALSNWLATPTQLLAEVTVGAVFHDGLGQLGPARANLRWYPTTSGSTCSPANGSASPRKRPSSAAVGKWATNSVPPSSPHGWHAT